MVFILENKMHRFLWDLEIQMRHLISIGRLVLVNQQRQRERERKKERERENQIIGITRPGRELSEKGDKYLDSAKKKLKKQTKNAMEHGIDGYTIYNWCK